MVSIRNRWMAVATVFQFVLLVCLSINAQAVAQGSAPQLLQVDPPNWYVGMPDPLLLVRGENLTGSHFVVTGADLRSTTISANGRWAFLDVKLTAHEPGMLHITASNPAGRGEANFELKRRRPVAEQPRGFGPEDVLYLIMPDRFADGDRSNDQPKGFPEAADRGVAHAYHGGDLRGIEQHLDYLQQLGVTAIWTTPLYDNSAAGRGDSYHGYSATNMFAVDPHFGTMDDLRALIAAAHRHGIKFVLDTVPNHVGPGHPWTRDLPTPDWFHGTPAQHVKVDDDFQAVTDRTATAERRHVLLDGWFADVLPDMNEENPLVARYLTQNAIWWIEEAGLDGLRIDTFPYVPRSFWHGYNETLHQLYPQMKDVGEVFNRDPHVTSFFAGGRAHEGSDGTVDTLLDTPFDFPLYFALREALTGQKPMSAIADVFSADALYPHAERLVTFLGNHDTARFLHEKNASAAALRQAFALLATTRGMPQLYYGDEIAMTGGDDPDNRRDFPGGFQGDAHNSFIPSGRTEDEKQMHDWVSSLLQLRAHTAALKGGVQQTLASDTHTVAYVRAINNSDACGSERVVVALNNDDVAHSVVVPTEQSLVAGCSTTRMLLATGATATLRDKKLQIDVPAHGVALVSAQR